MALPILLAVVAMTLIIAVRYLAVSGAFAWATARRMPGVYARQRRQIGREIYWSLLSAGIYGLPAGVVAWGWQHRGWTLIYARLGDYPLAWYPLSIVAFLLAHDAWFYWTHRLMHRPALFRIAHAVHHASRPPTAWAAMSFHPWEALTGAVVIPALVFVVPIHISALGVVLAIMTVMGVTNHMGWEIFPRRFVEGRGGRFVITASHHQRHHSDYRCNYGLYFRFWDRLCGTDRGLGVFHDDPRRGSADGKP
ncbi:sterol desaturase family protein [Sphingomonas quercus]|uniref:Sterol desaturase family protein n=1 Tax=Sphingomonas quercus TaxID=2842451 RepID=A0ABS6BGP7_9SPHN|nr:sterol desaturase family protein [Sphingomonas quercus]MBU3077478.1 sterol desaturase family protein [Sphingomonas quercus]